MKTNDLLPEDWGFIQVKPDPDFSPEHNKHVIRNAIKKTQERMKKGRDEWVDKTRERVHAVASYLMHANHKDTPIDKYFTKQYLAYLRGDDVRNMLMTKLSPQAWKNQKIISKGSR